MSEQKQAKRYTVTSALPYANGPLHIGHFAGAYLPADIYVRYLRSMGEDVVYVCGSDEHGTAIAIQALNEGTTPRAIVDKYHEMIKETFEKFNISFDIYSRTSSPLHHETAQAFFRKFYDEGKLIKKSSSQLYDPEKEIFLADRFVYGTCPNCQNPDAYGNQCEKCGKDLSPDELIDPKSKISGAVPVLRDTEHFYLPLDQYEEWLKKYILEEHSDWKDNVLGQTSSWLQEGLRPRAITRDLDWGVPLPIEGAKGKVLYVWFDAPIGYISATKEWAEKTGKDWEPYWKDEDTALVHFIGKDNIVFHCIIFPSILKGHGGYIVPENVPANEFMNLMGKKISTSRGWAVWMHEYLEDFPGRGDVLRYVLTAIMPETKDANFEWGKGGFQQRNNSELVDTFANFVNRVKVLTIKNFNGVPERGDLTKRDKQLIAVVKVAAKKVGENISKFRFREALNEMMNIARAGDLYLSETEPWKLVKTDKAAAGHVLNLGLNVAAMLAVVAEPFMPETSAKIFTMLGIEPLKWKDLEQFDHVPWGGAIENIPHLFTRITDDEIAVQEKKLEEMEAAAAGVDTDVPEIATPTTFDDFQKMDIRTGTILEAEKVKKSKRLLKLLIDTGRDKRTIVSGVAEHFQPEDLLGKQCILLANLQPRKIMGVESNGMVLFAEDTEGKLHLVGPESEIGNGSLVK